VIRSRDSGRINIVSLALIAGVLAAGYYGWMYVPLWVDNLSLKEVMRVAANEANRNRDDDLLRKEILYKVKDIGKHEVVVDGQRQWPGSIDLLADDVHITRDADTKTVTIQIEYDRQITYPFTDRQKVVHFAPFVTASTENVKW
jgi:hypothetical protein